MQSTPSLRTVRGSRPVYSGAPWLTDTGVPSARDTHIHPGKIFRTASHTLSRSSTAPSGSGRADLSTFALDAKIVQSHIAHIRAKRRTNSEDEWTKRGPTIAATSTTTLKAKAPTRAGIRPRNLPRRTTKAIASGSRGGLYHAANAPPATIKAASPVDIRFLVLKLINVSRSGIGALHGPNVISPRSVLAGSGT